MSPDPVLDRAAQDAADQIGHRIAARWGGDPAYWRGMAYAFLTIEVGADINGIRLRLPAFTQALEADAARRLISYETTLGQSMRPAEAKALAERFRALAVICDQVYP